MRETTSSSFRQELLKQVADRAISVDNSPENTTTVRLKRSQSLGTSLELCLERILWENIPNLGSRLVTCIKSLACSSDSVSELGHFRTGKGFFRARESPGVNPIIGSGLKQRGAMSDNEEPRVLDGI